MKFEKVGNYLWVTSNIYFDYEECFCGRPYISLSASKEFNSGWGSDNTIFIGIEDDDDFDTGLLYKCNSDNFIDILHELINWMRDHEQGISNYDDIWSILEFFPDCGCERVFW